MGIIFGNIVQQRRKDKGFKIRDFIGQLGVDLSPSYITKIELHGEIPSPELICRIAKVLQIPHRDLWEIAKANKLQAISEALEAKYREVTKFRSP